MENPKELEALKDEIHRKYGRNCLLFLQIEGILKAMLPRSNISGYISKLEAAYDKRCQQDKRKTLGQLIGDYIGSIYADSGEEPAEPDPINEIFISSKFHIETDDAFIETLKQDMALLLKERNELIHHFLQKWDFSSVEGRNAAIAYLDQQYEKALPEVERIEARAKDMAELMEVQAAFFSSDQGKEFFDFICLRSSRLMIQLTKIAGKTARPDGWSPLTQAGQLLRQQAREELSSAMKKYACKNLRSLMAQSELFEIMEEPTEKGGVRILYRIKPDEWTSSPVDTKQELELH